MFEKNDKRRLYQLIDMYLAGTITASVFCDEFYYSYDLEISNDDLTELEQKSFSELNRVASRFSPYEEDYKLDSKAFVTTEELKEKVIETKEKLREQKVLNDKITKQKLYSLIDQYLSNKIDETIFCNDFHNTLVNEVYYVGLTNVEHEVFRDLDDVLQCFTDDEESLKLLPLLVNAEQLREKVIEAQEKLKE